jgi:hypothetical protein
VAAPDERNRRLNTLLLAVALLIPLVVFAAILFNPGTQPEREGGLGPIAVASALPSPSRLPIFTAVPELPVPATPQTSVQPVPPSPSVTEPPTPVRPPPTTAPANSGSGPATAVRDFYDQVENHNWDAAIARWSPSMQQRYPPDEWLIDRFRPTTRIDITYLKTTSVDRNAGRARVSLTLIEYRRVKPSPRTFAGAWDVVRLDGRWVLDHPHF